MSVGKKMKNKKYPNTQKDITFYEIGQEDHKLCSCVAITGTFTDCIFCFLVKLTSHYAVFLPKRICRVLECCPSTLSGQPKALVAPVFLFCDYIESTFQFFFFFSEINGELMIPLFSRCARKGGFGILFF